MEAPNQEQIYNSALSTVQAQNAPVIQSLQDQKPTLENQYNSLVTDLKGQQGIALGNTGEQTRRDFGARGIPGNSGLFSQVLGERQQPIAQDYSNRFASASATQQTALQQLATQIATAQSGVTDQARQLAQQQYGNAQNAYQSQLDEAYRQKQLNASAATSRQLSLSGGGQVTPTASAPGQAAPYQPSKNDFNAAQTAFASVGNSQGGRDKNVDANEQIAAVSYLITNHGYTPQQAAMIVANALNQKYGGYSAYTAPNVNLSNSSGAYGKIGSIK